MQNLFSIRPKLRDLINSYPGPLQRIITHACRCHQFQAFEGLPNARGARSLSARSPLHRRLPGGFSRRPSIPGRRPVSNDKHGVSSPACSHFEYVYPVVSLCRRNPKSTTRRHIHSSIAVVDDCEPEFDRPRMWQRRVRHPSQWPVTRMFSATVCWPPLDTCSWLALTHGRPPGITLLSRGRWRPVTRCHRARALLGLCVADASSTHPSLFKFLPQGHLDATMAPRSLRSMPAWY